MIYQRQCLGRESGRIGLGARGQDRLIESSRSLDHRCKNVLSFILKFKKHVFMFFFIFKFFLCFLNVVILLLLKQKRTKLQI